MRDVLESYKKCMIFLIKFCLRIVYNNIDAMKLLVYLLITLLLAQSQSGFVCSICQTTMSALSKALTFITPTYAAVEFL